MLFTSFIEVRSGSFDKASNVWGWGGGGGLTHMLGVDMPFKPSNLDTYVLIYGPKKQFSLLFLDQTAEINILK